MPSVNPYGNIYKTIAKNCTLMGNRGVLKVEHGELVGLSRWKTQSWIYCSIEKKFAPKEGDKPLRYTKLFFLDEFTALSAGHRPCGYCLPDRFEAFIVAWLTGNPEYGYCKNDYKKIDKLLHVERKNSDRGKQTYPEKLGNLPDGVMVTLDISTGESYLLQAGSLRLWSPVGYSDAISLNPNTIVQLLTPKSVVKAILAGFTPGI